MQFASDNTAGVHPQVMAALAAANAGDAAAYGHDPLTARAEAALRDLFDAPEAEVLLVAGGTAANALALSAVSLPWGKVFCSETAHVLTSECGAIPFHTGGATLVPVPAADGRIAPAGLAPALQAASRKDVHAGECSALTLTNLTELGTLYSPAEVAALSALARTEGLAVHMDGARLANAVAALGCAPADLTHRAGVDILSFGGTKNGAMMAEAVIVFDPARARGLDMRRMRAGHLMSKHRYLAAQILALTQDGLWLRLAAHANAMAARLAAGLAEVPGAALDLPVQGNQLFPQLPAAAHARALDAGASYHLWPRHLAGAPGSAVTARMVCSWSTTEAEVERLLDVLRG